MSEALVIRNDSARSLSFTAQAEAMRQTALEASALVGRVKDAVENAAATEAMLGIATLLKTVESARVSAKEPVLAFGRHIDDQAKAFVVDLKAEQMRLAKLVGDFQALENAKRQAAERLAQMERERIERERREEEIRILTESREREPKEQRERDDAQRLIREASDAKAREVAERHAIELKRQQQLAAAKSHEELDAAQERASNAQAAVFVAAPEPIRAKAQVVKEDLKFDVVDIHKLYKFHQNLVTLTPNLPSIKELLNAGVAVQGVGNVRKETVASVRVGRQPQAIEV